MFKFWKADSRLLIGESPVHFGTKPTALFKGKLWSRAMKRQPQGGWQNVTGIQVPLASTMLFLNQRF